MPVKSKSKAEVVQVPVEVTGLVKSVEKSMVMVITTDEDYTLAGKFLNEVGSAIKRINDSRLAMTRPLDQSKKLIMEAFKAPLDRLEKAKDQVSREMLAYHRQQEELARKERERVEREEARKLEKIREAEEKGDNRMLKRWVDRDVPLAMVEAPVAAGVTTRTYWSFEILDPMAVPREYLVVDEGALQRLAMDLKEGACVPGVRFYPEDRIVRTGR